jgi:hypothetical protein
MRRLPQRGRKVYALLAPEEERESRLIGARKRRPGVNPDRVPADQACASDH